jgi:6-phosphogluconolactonase
MTLATPTRTPRHGARLDVFGDQDTLSRAAAEEIVSIAQTAVEEAGRFTIALSGGPAPGPVFELLADEHSPFRKRLPWNRTHFFWGDERHVSPDHPDSNYRLAHNRMLSKVPVPNENIHRVRTELADAHEAADLYEAAVREFFGLRQGEFPRFDLMWQGLGANGHTASLFPGTAALDECHRSVVANWVEKLQAHRITATYPVLNNAATVLFVVSGCETADALNQVLFGPQFSVPLPAQLVAPVSGRLIWLVDQKAAGKLPA